MPAEPKVFTPRLRGVRVFLGAMVASTFLVPWGVRAVHAYPSGKLGAQLWVSRYNGPANLDDTAYALGVSPGGTRVFVTGYSAGGNALADYLTAAYEASTGTQLWVRRYDGSGHGGDIARALAVSPDGTKVFVTGNVLGIGTEYDYGTVAYDAASGSQLWARAYDGPNHGFDTAYSIAVTPDASKAFVTGYSNGATGHADYATIAYDAATGSQLWVGRYDGTAHGGDVADAVTVSPDGSRVFVTGYSDGSSTATDIATVAYDASTGHSVWIRRYDGPAHDYDFAYSIAVSPGGSTVFVAGHSTNPVTLEDDITIAYATSTGSMQWVRRYNGPANAYDSVNAIAVSPGGSSVFVSGYSKGTKGDSDYDYATVAYDASTGAQLWVNRFTGPGNSEDIANDVEVSPGGSTVYVTGEAVGPTGYEDYATVAYDSTTGARRWSRYYDGPGHRDDAAWALGLSSGGGPLYVTGGSWGSNSDADFATVAYDSA